MDDQSTDLPLAGDTDRELARRILQGDREAFERCFDDLTPRLYRFASARLHADREVTRDIVQATVCKAIENLGSFRGEATLFTWMCGICRFEILAWLKSRRRAESQIDLAEDSLELRATLESAAAALDAPDTELERREVARLVHATLDHLPRHYGQALEWKYCEELSVKQIAERLGVGPKAAESILTRAREAFRSAFPAAATGPSRTSAAAAGSGDDS